MPIHLWLFVVLLAGSGTGLAAPDPALVEPNVFRIITPEGDGTGFWLADADVLVTNWHVIKNADTIAVAVPQPQEPQLLSARVLKSSVDYDIALLAVEGLVRPGLSLALGNDPIKGQAVWAIGFPGAADRGRRDRSATEATLTTGIVNRLLHQPWKDNGPALSLVQHDARLGHGNSGSPLLDACGHVLGVNTQASYDLLALASYQYALSVAELRSLLERWRIGYRSTAAPCPVSLKVVDASAKVWLMGLLLGLLALTPVLVLRAPRERIIHVVESYSQYMRRLKLAHRDAPPPMAALPAGVAALRLLRDNEILYTIQCPLDRPCERVIGRNVALCDLTVDDDTISRRHLRVFWQPWQKQWYIEDLNSSNGTWMDGLSLPAYVPMPLRQGARLIAGELELIVDKQP